jgi:ABC-2 type transport system permease protein
VRKFWAVARREYTERIRSRWFLFATLAGPVFFGLIIIVPLVLMGQARPSVEVSNILVLDATGTDLGSRVTNYLRLSAQDTMRAAVREVTPAELAAAEDSATHEVMRHQRIGYLVLDTNALTGGEVQYAGRNASALGDIDLLTQIVRQSILAQRLEREGLAPSRITALTALQTRVTADRITDRGRGGSGELSAIVAYALGFLLYTMIVIYGNVILRGVVDEKSSRVAEVVVASAPPDTLLAGKVIGVSLVAVTQVAAWAALSAVVYRVRDFIFNRFGMDSPAFPFPAVDFGTWVALILLLVLGFLAYAALFAGMGAMVSNQDDAQQAALPVTMVVMCAVVLIPPVLVEPTGMLARVASWFPFTAPILMPVRMTVVQVPWYEIAATLGGVAAGCAAAVWVAARIYRVGLLMYGKRPSIAELARWVTAATRHER